MADNNELLKPAIKKRASKKAASEPKADTANSSETKTGDEVKTGDEAKTEETKRKPGRPKKQSNVGKVSVAGIVLTPSNAAQTDIDPDSVYVVEVLYRNPSLFKHIVSLYKNVGISHVKWRFDLDGIKIISADEKVNNKVYTVIYGNKMDSYYAKGVYDKIFNVNTLNLVLNGINAGTTSIKITMTESDVNKHMNVSLMNDTMQTESRKEVDVLAMNNSEELHEIQRILAKEGEYPVKFCLDVRFFKNVITDFKMQTDKFSICKYGTGHLFFRHTIKTQQSGGVDTTIFKDDSKIKLESTVNADDLFTCDLFINSIQTVVGASLTDEVYISTHIERPLIMKYLLDQDCDNEGKKVDNTERAKVYVTVDVVKV